MMIIFVLSAGMILTIYSFLGLKKEYNSFENILDNNMDDFKNSDLEIGNLRKEMAETIMELQKEIITLKDDIEGIKEFNKNNDNIKIYRTNKKNVSSIKNKDNVKEKVNMLIKEGYSIEQISNELNLGKGEILLIRDLYTR